MYADHLDGGLVEQERREPAHVARVECLAERVERGRRRRAGIGGLGLDQLSSSTVQGGLDRAHGGRKRLGDLLEREVEDVLEHHRGALLRRERRDQGSRGLPGGARLVRGAFLRSLARLLAHPARAIDPEVRGDAEQPSARIRRRLVHAAEGDEGARQGVLRQVLGIPGSAGQVAAVPEEIGPVQLVEIEEAVPGTLDCGSDVALGTGWRSHAGETNENGPRILRRSGNPRGLPERLVRSRSW